jgi:RecG-like helicase
MSVISLRRHGRRREDWRQDATRAATPPNAPDAVPAGCVPIGQVEWRQRARVSGTVRSLRVQPWADVPTLQCVLVDSTGGITVVFLGRRHIAGIEPGTRMTVEGVVGAHDFKLAMLNPDYSLLAR